MGRNSLVAASSSSYPSTPVLRGTATEAAVPPPGPRLFPRALGPCVRAIRLHANKINYNIYQSTNRIGRLWNSVPSPDLRTSLSLIKWDLVTFLWDHHFLTHFNPDSLPGALCAGEALPEI